MQKFNRRVMKTHEYSLNLLWTGNSGLGTSNYRTYERSHTISIPGKPLIEGSSDPAFRGDTSKYNPEELLVASLSSCHMLWYLHLCANSGIVVTSYSDNASGMMTERANGSGKFTEVTLRPKVQITDILRIEEAKNLHKKANELCFIANSVNFPVRHEPEIRES